jgi:imidazolonepropionase-like amidohydrolase
MKKLLLAALCIAGVSAQEPAPIAYAITNARIVPVSGAQIDNGTVVLRNGLIAQVGAGIAAPAGAVVIDGKGLTVYPGLIDMGSAVGLDLPPGPRAENAQTTEEIERAKRALLVRPQLRAAEHVNRPPASRRFWRRPRATRSAARAR